MPCMTGEPRRERACRRVDSRGFTLIELTVVLAVIVTLALILTPSITNFITDSRVARTRSDTQTVAAAIVQFYKDNGFFPQWSLASNGGPGTAQNKVDLLVSEGNVPVVASPNTWTTGMSDPLEDQLVNNAPNYTMRTATANFGWNGPYVSTDIGADAWNNRYAVNVGLIDVTQGTKDGSGATKNAVWVLSSGPNGQIETAYQQAITAAVLGGDDIAVRVQ
ncbi:MAG: prepilin-type N-terminal cleavage/methylation domain-containing protein [Acidobacteria bacterium]|nr:prepilin-type N-terminal cleavage/methylation domain-containing protein [Acidobacteriota bacterium]